MILQKVEASKAGTLMKIDFLKKRLFISAEGNDGNFDYLDFYGINDAHIHNGVSFPPHFHFFARCVMKKQLVGGFCCSVIEMLS